MMKFFIILVFSLACAHRTEREGPSDWTGRDQVEILKHPYFKNLKAKKVHSSKNSQWFFIDQTPFQTGAYCQGLGGCTGLPSYNCQYRFSFNKNVIQELEVIGVCPPRKTIEPLKK